MGRDEEKQIQIRRIIDEFDQEYADEFKKIAMHRVLWGDAFKVEVILNEQTGKYKFLGTLPSGENFYL